MVLPVWFATLSCYLVGFVWPAFASFKAIESPEGDDDKQWLTYWVCYSVFTLVELVEFVISWVPFYYELKLACLFYLSYPEFRGAEHVYQSVVRPFLKKHEETIDNVAGKAMDATKDLASQVNEENIYKNLNAGAASVQDQVKKSE